jgi:hypothetical protein
MPSDRRYYSTTQIAVAFLLATPLASILLLIINIYKTGSNRLLLFFLMLVYVLYIFAPIILPALFFDSYWLIPYLAITIALFYFNEKFISITEVSPWRQVFFVCILTYIIIAGFIIML